MSLIDRQNPIVSFSYLLIAIIITMFTFNPILLGMSFISSLILYCCLAGLKKTLLRFVYALVFILVTTIINPLFARQGMTYLFDVAGLTVTLEAVLNGVAIGVLFSSIVIWFGVINILLDSDKISYIFSKFTPKIGTILSVSLGLIPKYIAQYKIIDNNFKGLGLYNNVKLFKKVKIKMHALSTLISWSIEGALTLSDSMSARGFNLKGKRVYNKYKFCLQDILFLIVSMSLGIVIIAFLSIGTASYYYYPTFKQIQFDSSFWIYIVTFLYMNIMTFYVLWESAKWQFMKLKI